MYQKMHKNNILKIVSIIFYSNAQVSSDVSFEKSFYSPI